MKNNAEKATIKSVSNSTIKRRIGGTPATNFTSEYKSRRSYVAKRTSGDMFKMREFNPSNY